MLRLFDCAGMAARAQMSLAVLIGIIPVAMGGTGWNFFGLVSASPALLRWIFLATAAVTAMSFRQSLRRTAARLASETDLLSQGRAKRMRIWLLMNLRLATGAMAVLTLAPAPDLLSRVFAPVLESAGVQYIWAGVMSVGLAYFGAAASAARRTLRSPPRAPAGA